MKYLVLKTNLIAQRLLLQGFKLLVYLGNKLKVELQGSEFGERNGSKNVHKVFNLGNKHLNNLWGKTNTYISLSNIFSFTIFSLIPLVFWMFLSKDYVHVLSKLASFLILFYWLVFFLVFVLLLGLGQEAQQIMCGGY